MTDEKQKQSSLLTYVANFLEKRDQQLQENETNSIDESDFEDIDLTADPVIETRESEQQTYKQPLFVRQYQPPTPEPVEIQIREVLVKPHVQHPPVHVHIKPRDDQRTPSPILIRNAPPISQLTKSYSSEPIVYNKYIPVNNKPVPQQIVIHRYPDLPPKPRPIVVDQWLPNKPRPKRILCRRVSSADLFQNETKRPPNRYIEYKAPHTRIELEITHLPIIKMDPKDYRAKSINFSELPQLRSSDLLFWRI